MQQDHFYICITHNMVYSLCNMLVHLADDLMAKLACGKLLRKGCIGTRDRGAIARDEAHAHGMPKHLLAISQEIIELYCGQFGYRINPFANKITIEEIGRASCRERVTIAAEKAT